MEEDEAFVDENVPRRSLRIALIELNEHIPDTPKSTNPEEMLVIQRGPRKKPITWSPVDYHKIGSLLAPSRDRTPEPVVTKSEINPRLRRRLIMSPSKSPSQEMDVFIAKKLRALKNISLQ
ncbi:uncharacterized protein LOC126887954 [Diabrotica virgifera virgifera]|uniref:Uncharacterized protein LOC114334676 n=1 Tax=Diabrotica virgifera virgifera TaxID=50390 RepID=A0A6P7FVZ8_DIAVI|nr:uncharacterized protein LOC126887954 [Diabrotica virgifera virgifera]